MKRREKLSTDLTPLLDVVFILLIFFIVTSTFKKEDFALLLDLPNSSVSQKQESKYEEVTIELSSSALAYKGKPISFDDLNLALRLVKSRDEAIILRIDKNVAYQKVVQILELLQAHNLNNLALVVNEK